MNGMQGCYPSYFFKLKPDLSFEFHWSKKSLWHVASETTIDSTHLHPHTHTNTHTHTRTHTHNTHTQNHNTHRYNQKMHHAMLKGIQSEMNRMLHPHVFGQQQPLLVPMPMA